MQYHQKNFIQQKFSQTQPGRLSGLRILLKPRLPSRGLSRKWHQAVLVPDHGNGWYAMASHHLSFYPLSFAPCGQPITAPCCCSFFFLVCDRTGHSPVLNRLVAVSLKTFSDYVFKWLSGLRPNRPFFKISKKHVLLFIVVKPFSTPGAYCKH